MNLPQTTDLDILYSSGGVADLPVENSVVVDLKHIDRYGNNLFDILRSEGIDPANMTATMLANGMSHPSDISQKFENDEVSVILKVPSVRQ